MRRALGPCSKRDLGRAVLLLFAVVFLVLPFVSISDDIGYFNYYFSRHQAPDAYFWVSGARREKDLPSLVVLHAFVFLLTTAALAFRRVAVLGNVVLTRSVRVTGRGVAANYLRAPPSSLF